MKKILSLLALICLSCMGAWAENTVIARMADLIQNASENTATVSSKWTTDVNSATPTGVYEFNNTKFVKGITCQDLVDAYAGSKYITVAMWVYRTGGTNVFGYGDGQNGIMYKCNASQLAMTTKGVSDFASHNYDNWYGANQWNLIAYTISGNGSTNGGRIMWGEKSHYFGKSNSNMAVPADASKKFAIGSGNQGEARENFQGLIANLTVIQSDALIDNATVLSLVGAEPKLAQSKYFPAEGTYYAYIRNKEVDRGPYLYNDMQYNDDITLQAWNLGSKTNGYIWKVTSDGNGNITVLNAETGKGIKATGHCQGIITNFQYTNGSTEGYYNMINTSLISGESHDRLNCSNTDSYHNEANLRAVTTWNGSHADNDWRFDAVDTEGLVEYTVSVAGLPNGTKGWAVYNGAKATPGGFLLAADGLAANAFGAGSVAGYGAEVSLSDHNVTVTYSALPAAVEASTNEAKHNYHINLNNNSNYLSTYTYPTTVAEERGVFQFYEVSANVYKIYEAGQQKWLTCANTDAGKNKIGFTATEANAATWLVTFVEGNSGSINICPMGNTANSFNWHGGAHLQGEYITATVGLYGKGDGNSKWVATEITDTDAATTAITNSTIFAVIAPAKDTKTRAAKYSNYIGEGVNKYTADEVTTKDDWEVYLTNLQNAIDEKNTTMIGITKSLVDANLEALTINQPTPGFYRIKGNTSNKYADLDATPGSGKSARVAMSANTGVGTIFYIDEQKHFISYKTGFGIQNTCDPGTISTTASTYTFAPSSLTVGRYYIYNGNTVLYDNGANANTNCLDRQGLGEIAQTANWTLEPVETLPFTIASSGYSTFNSPVATAIPAGVKAYTAKVDLTDIDNPVIVYTKVEDVIPANSPVFLAGEAGAAVNFNLDYDNDDAALENNDFEGTVAAMAIAQTTETVADKYYYVLSNGQFKFATTKINGFRAYLNVALPYTAAASSNFRVIFADELATGIDAVEAIPANAEIFDLQGRRVNNAHNGLYIVNGKKVIR